MTRETQDQRFDRARDYRKHDFEPADSGAGLSDIPDARTIAVLCKGIDEDAATSLIQSFANTVASLKVREAVCEAYDHCIQAIAAPAKEPSDA